MLSKKEREINRPKKMRLVCETGVLFSYRRAEQQARNLELMIGNVSTSQTVLRWEENVKALAQKTDIATFGLEGRNKSRPEIALNQFTGHDWSHSSPVHQLTRNERRLDDGDERERGRDYKEDKSRKREEPETGLIRKQDELAGDTKR